MRCLVLFLAVAALGAGQPPDIGTLLDRSIEASDHNWKIARNYTFVERNEQRQLESDGRVKSRRILAYDITLLEGSPYRRLIGRDDKPLSPEENLKEEEKLRKSNEDRRKETEAERAKRISDFEKRRQKEIEIIRELPKAFDFQLAGEQRVAGTDTWVLDATPRPGYEPHDRRTRFFPKLRGRIWISKQDYSWVKVDAEVIDTISFGFFLARLGKGSHLHFEQVHVNNEVWLPAHIALAASARVALIKKYNIEQDISYRNYRKFQSDSHIVSTEALQ